MPEREWPTAAELGNLIDIHQAAQMLNVSRRTMDRLTEEGHLTFIRMGRGTGRKMFTERWLLDYLKRHTERRDFSI